MMGTVNSGTLSSMTDGNSLRSEHGETERLLPGLPDDIILDHIVPKLRWRMFHILSSVSCRWREAIQGRDVYDARVRSQSTEKLLMLNHRADNGKDRLISLYSVRDDSWYQLLQFPKSRELSQKGFPKGFQCISLDGNIYVLGGVATNNDDGYNPCSEVYVLDLAGQREWKQCAKLPQPRYAFGCGVVDGKIYVLGGLTSSGNPASVSMVYEPKANVWSSIWPMKYMRRYHKVITVGEELFVYGGEFLHPEHNTNYNNLPFEEEDASVTAEVYHAGKDEWRFLELSILDGLEALFTAQGKLYMTSPRAIYGHDIDSDGNSFWTQLHSFLFGDEYDLGDDFEMVDGAQVVDNKLLRLISRTDANEDLPPFLYESIGFGSKKKEIASREKIESGILDFDHFLSAIQL